MVKISIITPVYNTKKYLRRCIESILSQSYSNLELLLINDGSTDESGLICDEYAKNDSRVKVFHTSNGGPSRARNIGLENISGDYVLFVDSDDWVDDKFISHYLCDNYQEYDAIFGMWDIQTNNGIINPSTLNKPYIGNDFAKAEIELSGKYSFELNCNKMIKSEIIKKYNIRFVEGIHSNEDDIFTYDYAKHIKKFIVLPEAHYHEIYIDEFDRHLSARVLQYERLFYRLASSIMKNITNNIHNIPSHKLKEYVKEAYSLHSKYNKHLVNKYRNNHKIWSLVYDIVFAFNSVTYVRFCSKLVSFIRK